MKTTKHDDGLEWLREIRARLARKFDYDPHKAAAYYRRIQKTSGAKIYEREVPVTTGVQAVDVLHDRADAQIAAGQCSMPTTYLAAHKRKVKRAK
jgi:hypothetical protein